MATTTRGVLWEVLAPVVRWPLYSPLRFGLVVLAVGGVLLAAGELTGSDDTGEAPSAAEAVEETSPTPGERSRSVPDEIPSETVDPDTRATLSSLARRFVVAYLDTDQPSVDWLQPLRDMATPDLGRALKTIDPANVDLGHRVVRVEIRGVGATAGSAVVQTDRGEATVTMAYSGLRWEVTRIVPASSDLSEAT